MDSDDDAATPTVRRRSLLIASGAAVAGAVVGGAAVWGGGQLLASPGSDDGGDGESDAADAPKPPETRRFVSTELTVPRVKAWTAEGATLAAGYVFTTPRGDTSTGAIFDNDGEPVWIAPNGIDTTDLRVQSYRGEPVITFWSGRIAEGNGHGIGSILDTSYREVARVNAGGGALSDLHEFTLTDRGTALLTAYPIVRTDLRDVGGPREGYIYGCRVQEVDIASGRLLLDWDMLEHVPVDESRKRIDDDTEGSDRKHPFDPFHINSAEADGDRLLLSARHTCALYAIDRRTGELLWRLGGSASDFDVADDAAFAWQHDARWHGENRISIFDNHGVKGDDEVSAGLILSVDEEAKTATLEQAFRHGEHMGYAMGNTQLLDGGGAMVGWGSAPAATEFDASGTAVFELSEVGTGAYRTYRHTWSATPAAPPALVVQREGGELTAYMSWNGATQVASWRLMTGSAASDLASVATAERAGFETSMTIPDAASAAVARVDALDADGGVLASSPVVRVDQG